MRALTRTATDPVPYKRSKRNQMIGGMTSGPAGRIIPLAFAALFREDSMRGSITVNCEMMETQELLANKVHLRITAHFVPFLALERFAGSRDLFDKSFNGEPLKVGDPVVPWIETHAMGAHGSNAVYKALGLHGKPTDMVNTSVLEVYNLIKTFRNKNRSKDLPERGRLDTTLAKAFWLAGRFEHVVPDFDQAVLDGEVALNITEAKMPVKGIGIAGTPTVSTNVNLRETGGTASMTYPRYVQPDAVRFRTEQRAGFEWPDIWTELEQNGITVSLSNIDRAREMRSFAKLRERYTGHDDDWIISMLMNGIHIPELDGKQPVLIADKVVNFGQSKRYATDSGNLTESATSGGVSVRVPLFVPRTNLGGIVMVCAEAIPAQMFERQQDPWFHTTDVDDLPEAMRDYLDPEKVDIVSNGQVDTSHATPNGTFGYAPQHWKWTSFGPRIGGKFYRPTVDGATDEERRRFWAAEMINPALSADFFEVSTIHQKPFLDQEADPFEFALEGNLVITGNTQFGGLLHEAEDNYDAIDEETQTDRIEKD